MYIICVSKDTKGSAVKSKSCSGPNHPSYLPECNLASFCISFEIHSILNSDTDILNFVTIYSMLCTLFSTLLFSLNNRSWRSFHQYVEFKQMGQATVTLRAPGNFISLYNLIAKMNVHPGD